MTNSGHAAKVPRPRRVARAFRPVPAATGTPSPAHPAGEGPSSSPRETKNRMPPRPAETQAPTRRADPGSAVLPVGLQAIANAMSEDELEEFVLKTCKGLGVLRFHNPDSRRVKERGLPDDILIGPGGVLWRELKDMKRKLTPEQEQVGEMLTARGQDWAVWRPVDRLSGRIVTELRAIARPVFARGIPGGAA